MEHLVAEEEHQELKEHLQGEVDKDKKEAVVDTGKEEEMMGEKGVTSVTAQTMRNGNAPGPSQVEEEVMEQEEEDRAITFKAMEA